jgi:hypothetical protein
MTIKNKNMELLNYIKAPMSKESMELAYSANNIRYEKCELYGDFIQSLISLIFDTYMGDEITNAVEKKNHFRWCWYRNIESFEKEGIYFNSQLHDYFLDFMLEVYYTKNQKGKNQPVYKNIPKLWKYIFDYKTLKSKSDLDNMIDVYKRFEYSIKPEKTA